MGEQTVGRVLPTEPGWWWRHAYGEREAVHVIANNGARSMPRGADLVWFDASPSHHNEREVVGWCAVTDDGEWLAPVAPIGSVPPEVYAGRVFGAYRSGFADGLEGDTAGRNVVAGVLAATLEAHGLTHDEAARVVAGVAS